MQADKNETLTLDFKAQPYHLYSRYGRFQGAFSTEALALRVGIERRLVDGYVTGMPMQHPIALTDYVYRVYGGTWEIAGYRTEAPASHPAVLTGDGQ